MTGAPGDAAGVASSLALLRRSVGEESGVEGVGPDVDRCPRRLGWFLVGQSTGQVVAARCGAAFCVWCGPAKAQEVAGAIGLAAPERMVRLSLVRERWRDTSWRLRNVVEDIRAEGYRFEYCVHVEPNPAGTGHHAHMYQKGDYVPQAYLQERSQAHGFGIPDIRKFVRRGGPKVAYGLKLAGIDYGLKLASRQDSLDSYLGVNGGRLCHHSRRFFADESGSSCGLGEGRKAWRRLAFGEQEAETWVLTYRAEWEEVSRPVV